MTQDEDTFLADLKILYEFFYHKNRGRMVSDVHRIIWACRSDIPYDEVASGLQKKGLVLMEQNEAGKNLITLLD